MKILKALILIISLSFNSCSDLINEGGLESFNLSDTLSISYSEILFNSEENLAIEFDSLISDGRCPTDLRCFWEGDAELQFILNNSNKKIKFSLHTAGSYFTKDTVLLGYNIKLLNVTPYPHSKISHNVESYEAFVVISKQ